MKQREFNKHLNSCCKKGKVNFAELAALPEEIKTGMTLYIIRNRGPVLQCLLTPQIDEHWLASMGYMYHSTSKINGQVFVHTCEHRIR